MFHDEDIKIFSSSKAVQKSDEPYVPMHDSLDGARKLGVALAGMTKEAERGFELNINDELLLQRRLLLCFAIATALEDNSKSIQEARTALNTFYDTIKRNDIGFYDDIGSSGHFSFYYLAFRRGGDVERRIGQTFAMLCSHDGDPIYQELGEALYCWFSSSIEKAINELDLNK